MCHGPDHFLSFSLFVNLLSSLSPSDWCPLSYLSVFLFHATQKSIDTLKPAIFTASGSESLSPLRRKGFAFGLQLQARICPLLIEASASLVISRHFINDSQLDTFLNGGPGIRLWMTVTLQCPSSSVFKPLFPPAERQQPANKPI